VGLADLEAAGVKRLVFESRQEARDTRDRQTIVTARKARLISRSLTHSFARPLEEPLLWIPDAIAGAVGAALVEEDRSYVEHLPSGAWTTRLVPHPRNA
jgi:hypothetical protein